MFEADFTHEGDHCTFEVLIDRLGIDNAALRPIAEIVHDIDLKDSKYGREETVGIERLIAGVTIGHKEDETRLVRAGVIFDDLYKYFKRKGPLKEFGDEPRSYPARTWRLQPPLAEWSGRLRKIHQDGMTGGCNEF